MIELTNLAALEKLEKIDASIITIGAFDGVHLGHQKLLARLVDESKTHKLKSIIFTFKNPPKSLISNNTLYSKKIITTAEKIELLKKFEVDYLINIDFNEGFKNISALEFIENILIKKLNVKKIIVGYDFKFGKDKSGDYNLLGQVFKNNLIHIEPLMIDNEIVSSTLIKQYFVNNKMKIVNKLLGYDYYFKGIVKSGRKIGRTIGFPTINIDYSDEIIEINGVYKVSVLYNNNLYKGVANIGRIPTFDITSRYIETYIFDFDKEIYGEEVKVYPEKFLREIIKFKNLDELKKQIIIDVFNCK
ncbi:MAG TPA: bifunctional riboflavin kinase/FAD synthetase [bacterium]|nr:bifunctional riboflavin kinase/FAD synthetase [bacterium]HPP88735.1 bifunctional riboflavin kinase/FAD synthetase [bacterium]